MKKEFNVCLRLFWSAVILLFPMSAYSITGGFESRLLTTEQIELQQTTYNDVAKKTDSVSVLPKVDTSDVADNIVIKGIRVRGTQLVDQNELSETLRKYENKTAGSDDLQNLMRDVASFYRSRGFLDVTVALPEQTIEKGIVELRVVENKISAVNILGEPGRYAQFITERTANLRAQPLHAQTISDLLERVQYDQNVDVTAAQVIPGVGLGESVLNLRVATRETQGFEIGLDNYRAPATGAEHLSITYNNKNSFGYGDSSRVETGVSQGSVDAMASYTYPVAKTETRLTPYVGWQRAKIIEGAASDSGLDINRNSLLLGFVATQPTFRAKLPWNYGIAMEWKRSDSYFAQEQFDNESLFVMQPNIQWILPRANSNWFSQLSTRMGTDTENLFWLTRFDTSYQQNLAMEMPTVVALRGSLQWTRQDLDLPASEKFAIGGAQNVRGYRQNANIFDSGVFASGEYVVRFDRLLKPLYRLTVYPFVDLAAGDESEEVKWIVGTGIGSVLAIGKHFESQIDWAYGWNVESRGDNLQDYGVYFRLKYRI